MILSEARRWIGTRFRHQGRLCRSASHAGGVDCLGLLIGVAEELSLKGRDGLPLSAGDWRGYGHHPDGTRLRERLAAALEEVFSPQPGDVALMQVQGRTSHLGFVSDLEGGPGLIHAYAPARAVVEHRLDEAWKARIVTIFRLPAQAGTL